MSKGTLKKGIGGKPNRHYIRHYCCVEKKFTEASNGGGKGIKYKKKKSVYTPCTSFYQEGEGWVLAGGKGNKHHHS